MKKLLMIGVVLLGGCAGRSAEPVLGVDHPADPGAPEAMRRAPSRTLEPDPADPVWPASTAASPGGGEGRP